MTNELIKWLDLIGVHFGINGNVHASKMLKSRGGDIIVINTDNEKYVGKVVSKYGMDQLDKKDQIEFIQEVLEIIHKDISALAKPIKTLNGEYFVMTDDKYLIVNTFLPGSSKSDWTTEEKFRVGQIVASFHSQSVEELPDIQRGYDFDLFNRISNSPFKKVFTPDLVRKYVHIFEWIRSNFEEKIKSSSIGLIHGDLIYTNILFDDTSNIYIVDYEFFGCSYIAFDLGTFLGSYRYFSRDELDLYPIIEGYNSIRSISSDEFELLPVMEVLRFLLMLIPQAISYKNADQLPSDQVEKRRNRLLERVDTILIHCEKLLDIIKQSNGQVIDAYYKLNFENSQYTFL